MKLRSLSPWPKSYDWLHSLTMNRTPEGKFQAVRVLKPGKPEEGEFEVMFEGSRDECAAYLRNVVRQDRERQGQGSDDDHATTTPL